MATGYITEQNDQISRGLVRGVAHVNKFGFNSTVGTAFETVWDGANTYTYIATAGTAVVTSSNTSSDNDGTVEIQGLDANYDLQTVSAVIGGAATSETFIRVFRVRMTDANTGSSNVGNITVTVDSKSAAIINATEGQTLMALYTVPRNKVALFKNFQGSLNKQKEADFEILTRNHIELVFNVKGRFGTFGVPVNYSYEYPLFIAEKVDIEIRVKAGATCGASAVFDLLILDNPRTMMFNA